jgi:tripartite-type tricarboxylate transporter receptor subunit TctC
MRIMASEEMRKRVFELGQNPIVSTSAEFSDVIRSDFPYWVRVIKESNVKPLD